MSTFKELYDQSKKDQTIKTLETEFREWTKKGEFLIGRLKAITEIQSRTNEGVFNMYLFETDSGPVKVILGTGVDSDVAPLMVTNRIYRVEYQGQLSLGGGRRMNQFLCEEIGVVGEATGEIKAAG